MSCWKRRKRTGALTHFSLYKKQEKSKGLIPDKTLFVANCRSDPARKCQLWLNSKCSNYVMSSRTSAWTSPGMLLIESVEGMDPPSQTDLYNVLFIVRPLYFPRAVVIAGPRFITAPLCTVGLQICRRTIFGQPRFCLILMTYASFTDFDRPILDAYFSKIVKTTLVSC